MTSSALAAGPYASLDAFDDWGIRALVTTRDAGTFSTSSDEPAAAVLGRWDALRAHLFGDPDVGRLVTARQVHGARVLVHDGAWVGWLRGPAADGHLAPERGTALAVSVADCVPVFVAHPSGATALLHSGWRGTEANIVAEAVRLLAAHGLPASELRVAMGAAICGRCYEVSPDVHRRLTGREVAAPTPVDLRAIIADQARALGVRDVRPEAPCTRCDNERFFSHRAGDPGRQVGVLYAPRSG
ncbi:Multi-copper polyphenol oxidoreductase, laccase [Gemmatirosa kalamazoonensis]|uniref:Multi-copper polyphenol oxidoreductase, laccase n=1 Tax=Gemmatirosa kalamazoonensis TaxID=861299 RepID=W0RIY3_9BACT|nr:polyphenol oxidase family protein [Gemmatirosa kalamazoonensis]AHG90721.1 Multi-copper polyphenol oxidoreductase, laccase [Gemmatirosa kalamazoonensis]